MRRYQTIWETPVNTSYNGYELFASGNDWGGVELVEKLRLMELAGIGQTRGSSYLTNATEFFWLASISRFSFFVSFFLHSTRNGLSILKESLDLDLSYRLSWDSTEAIWEKIGSPEKMKEVNAVIRKLLGGKATVKDFIHGSDAIVAADNDGNVCSMIHTINSQMWGTGLFVQGIALPHSGAIFKAYVKQTSPGGRLPVALQPAIAFKSEKSSKGRQPVMALSVVGSSYPIVVPQYVTNLLDSDMNPNGSYGVSHLPFAGFFRLLPSRSHRRVCSGRERVARGTWHGARRDRAGLLEGIWTDRLGRGAHHRWQRGHVRLHPSPQKGTCGGSLNLAADFLSTKIKFH